MTYQDVRSLVVECLTKEPARGCPRSTLTVQGLFAKIAEIAKTRDLKLDVSPSPPAAWLMNYDVPELHPNLRAPVWSIVWDLIIEGILRPGNGTGEPFELPHIHITEYGLLKGVRTIFCAGAPD